MQNLISTFNINVPTSYNAASGLYEGMLQISWSEPLTPNGVITEYSYTVLGPSPATVSANTISTDVMVTASLLPASTYTVRVTASTSAGAGEASMVTITVPEASKLTANLCVCVCVSMHTKGIPILSMHITFSYDSPISLLKEACLHLYKFSFQAQFLKVWAVYSIA